MENVSAVLQYFNARVEDARATGGWDWSVARVLDVIKGAPRPATACLQAVACRSLRFKACPCWPGGLLQGRHRSPGAEAVKSTHCGGLHRTAGGRESRARLTHGLPRAAADSLRAWRGDKLRQFPELRFTYEEEAAPEDFFVPMVWALVVAHTASVPWNLPARARRRSPAPASPGRHPQRELGAVELVSPPPPPPSPHEWTYANLLVYRRSQYLPSWGLFGNSAGRGSGAVRAALAGARKRVGHGSRGEGVGEWGVTHTG